MNIFTFTGHLGRNAEVKYLPNGTAICNFSVAFESGFGDKTKSSWANCAIFGKRAEGKLPEFLVTGQKVAISGELTLDEWEKDGQKNKALKVRVNTLDLIGSKEPTQSGADQPQKQEMPAAPDSGFGTFDDDIPFN